MHMDNRCQNIYPKCRSSLNLQEVLAHVGKDKRNDLCFEKQGNCNSNG